MPGMDLGARRRFGFGGSLTAMAPPGLLINCDNTRFLSLPGPWPGVEMVAMAETKTSSARPYAGVDAADRLAARRVRLLEAGLDLLGADRPEVAGLTVRGICREAGLTVRYFYESFTDKDEFISAVFDRVIADLATRTRAIVHAAPPDEQARAGIDNVVRTIADRATAVQRRTQQLGGGARTGGIRRAAGDAVGSACRCRAADGGERSDQGRRALRGWRGGAVDQRVAGGRGAS